MTLFKVAENVFWTVAVLVYLVYAPNVFAQERVHTGRPLWESFDTRSTGGARVTSEAAADHQGIIYAANDAGLLAFDGIVWHLFEAGLERRALKSVEYLGDDSWLVGGPETLGTFVPNATGDLVWRDLLAEISINQRPVFDSVIGILTAPDGHLILTDRSVLTWSDGVLNETLSDAPTGFSFQNNDLIFIETERALVQFNNSEQTEIKTPPGWMVIEPISVAAERGRAPVLITKRSGLFEMSIDSGRLKLVPMWESLPVTLDTASITSSVSLEGDRYLLGTNSGGLILLAEDGANLFSIDKRSGHRAGTIRSIVALPDGSAMAFHDGGATWVDTQSEIRTWDQANGLPSPVKIVAVDGATTYAGTEDGLYRSLSGHRMVPIAESGSLPIITLDRFTRSPMRGHTSLLVGRMDGLFDFYDNQLEQITSISPNAIHISKQQPSRLAMASDSGILLIEFKNGTWQTVGVLESGQSTIPLALTETSNGRLIAAFSNGTIVTFAADQWLAETLNIDDVPISVQTNARRLGPDSRPFFARKSDRVYLFLDGAPMLWDSRSESFSVDTNLSTQLSGDKARWISAASSSDSLWMQTDTGALIYQPAGPATTIPSAGNLAGTYEYGATLIDEPNKRVFIATPGALVQIPLEKFDSFPDSDQLPALSISAISTDGRNIYGGHGPISTVEIQSSTAAVQMDFSITKWNFDCSRALASITRDGSIAAFSQSPLDYTCRTTFNGEWVAGKPASYHLTLIQDGKPISRSVSVSVSVRSPWFATYWPPLILGAVIGLTAVLGLFTRRRAWPEPVARYLSLLSALFLLWAGGLASGVLISTHSLGVAAAQFTGLVGAALVLPLVVDNLMKMADLPVKKLAKKKAAKSKAKAKPRKKASPKKS